MNKEKDIQYLSVAGISFEELVCGENQFFHNEHLSIVLNGRPQDTTFLRKGSLYHVAEGRIILFLEGWASFNLDLESGYAEKGYAMLLPADVIVELKDCSDDLKVIAFVIKLDLPNDNGWLVQPSAQDFSQLLKLAYLTWDVAQHTPFRKEAVLPLVQAMVGNIRCIDKENPHDAGHHGGNRQEEIFKDFKRLVNQHCERERTIPFYAEQLHITPHHLSAVIKQVSGQSVMFWLNRAIILRAKVLLSGKNLMTYEVADRLNFSSPSAFHNFFKRVTGMTPKEYQTKEG